MTEETNTEITQGQLEAAIERRRQEANAARRERRAADDAVAAQRAAAEALIGDPSALASALLEAIRWGLLSDVALRGDDANELRFDASRELGISRRFSGNETVFLVDWPAAAQAVMAMGVLPEGVTVECSKSGRCVVKV